MVTEHLVWPAVRFSAIREAWTLYRRHWKVWSVAMLIALACDALVSGAATVVLHAGRAGMMGGLAPIDHTRPHVSQLLVGILAAGYFLGGMLRMAIRQTRGHSPRIEDLFHVTDVWFDLLLGALLLGLPIVLLTRWEIMLIPGVILSGLLMFTLPLVVDAGLPATGAIIRSWEVLRPQWMLAAAFHFVLTALTGLGFILGGLGLLVTGPIYVLALALVYRDFFPGKPHVAWGSGVGEPAW